MKGAPGFQKWPDPVLREWKRDFIIWLAGETGIRNLVETGTHMGGMALELSPYFDRIDTIELSPVFYQRSREMLQSFPNIYQHQGSSRVILKEVLSRLIVDPLMFWLDAHFSGGLTAHDGDPLPEELKVITQYRPESLILVDDMSGTAFEDSPVWPKDLDLSGWIRDYRTGIVLMHRGQFNIPEFE